MTAAAKCRLPHASMPRSPKRRPQRAARLSLLDDSLRSHGPPQRYRPSLTAPCLSARLRAAARLPAANGRAIRRRALQHRPSPSAWILRFVCCLSRARAGVNAEVPNRVGSVAVQPLTLTLHLSLLPPAHALPHAHTPSAPPPRPFLLL